VRFSRLPCDPPGDYEDGDRGRQAHGARTQPRDRQQDVREHPLIEGTEESSRTTAANSFFQHFIVISIAFGSLGLDSKNASIKKEKRQEKWLVVDDAVHFLLLPFGCTPIFKILLSFTF
jgi:hypothetical protein